MSFILAQEWWAPACDEHRVLRVEDGHQPSSTVLLWLSTARIARTECRQQTPIERALVDELDGPGTSCASPAMVWIRPMGTGLPRLGRSSACQAHLGRWQSRRA